MQHVLMIGVLVCCVVNKFPTFANGTFLITFVFHNSLTNHFREHNDEKEIYLNFLLQMEIFYQHTEIYFHIIEEIYLQILAKDGSIFASHGNTYSHY